MKIEFHRKTFVILGRLESMGKDEAWKKIGALGGYTSKTPRPSSDYIVIGQKPGTAKMKLVAKVAKPTLTEAQFLAAIKAAETGREEGQQDVGSNDAVAGLRGLLYESPGKEVWKKLQALLDQCSPDQLDVAVDYAEHHISKWPDPLAHPAAPLPLSFEDLPQELRVFSVAWRKLALEGERSARLRLGRRLNLAGMELRGDGAARITDHLDFTNLRDLDIGYTNRLDASFYESLCRSKHLPQLTALTLHFLNQESAAALCGEHNLTNLRHVTVARRIHNAWGDRSEPIYDQLFEAPWWSQIEGLSCSASSIYGYAMHQPTIYPQLARHAHRMGRLRHLVIEDSNRIDPLLETDLFLQLSRVSLAGCNTDVCEKVLAHLDDRREVHTVEVLDLSRGIFMGAHRRPKKHAKPPQKAAIERLLQSPDWGALREVVIDASLVGVRLRKKLGVWGEQAGVAITASPWKA